MCNKGREAKEGKKNKMIRVRTSLKCIQAPVMDPKTLGMFREPCLRSQLRSSHHLIGALMDVVDWVEKMAELQNLCKGM